MLFHISFEVSLEHRNVAQGRFLETGAMPPDGVTMLGRWHAASGRLGYLIAESDDLSAVARWTQQWTDLLTFEVEPVLEDEPFAAVLR